MFSSLLAPISGNMQSFAVVSLVIILLTQILEALCSENTLRDVTPSQSWSFNDRYALNVEGLSRVRRETGHGEVRVGRQEPADQEARIFVFNTVPRHGRVTVKLRGLRPMLKFKKLRFGEEKRQRDVKLTKNDLFYATYRENSQKLDETRRNLSQIVPRQLKKLDMAVFATHHWRERLALNVIVFNTSMSVNRTGELFICHALQNTYGVPYDIIAFDPRQCNVDGACFLKRVGRKMKLHDAIMGPLEQPGIYELKVVPADYVATIDHFKNAPSILGPERVFFEYGNGVRKYTVLAGELKSKDFPPQILGLTQVDHSLTAAFEYPATPFLVFNAFPSLSKVTVRLPHPNLNVNVSYGRAVKTNFTLVREQVYSVRSMAGLTTPGYFRVNSDIPYKKGLCLLVVDIVSPEQSTGPVGELDTFLSCWKESKLKATRGPGLTHITFYHGLSTVQGNLDVLFDLVANIGSAKGFPSRRRIFKVAHNLVLSNLQPSEIPAGYYEYSVVPKAAVRRAEDYDIVKTLLEAHSDSCIRMEENRTYYAIIHGTRKADSERALASRLTVIDNEGVVANVPLAVCHAFRMPPGTDPLHGGQTATQTSSTSGSQQLLPELILLPSLLAMLVFSRQLLSL